MAASLQEVLSGSPATPAAQPASAPEASAQAEGQPAAEQAVPDGEGETIEAATPAATPEAAKPQQDTRTVPIAALKDERRKRQELERKLAELEGQVKVYSQVAKPADATPPPNPEDQFYKDPVGFIRAQTSAERLRMSEDLMRDAHADYDEVVQAFVQAAQSAPHLVAQMQAAANPARYAYNAGKAYLQAREYGSIDEMRTKIREELKTEVLEELKREQAQQAANAVQPSLASARGAGTSAPPRWQGPTPLKSIFGR